MERITLATAIKNLSSNFLLLLSSLLALCLFISQSITSQLIIATFYAALLVITALGWVKPVVKKDRSTHTVSLLLATLCVFIGCTVFKETWSSSAQIENLASMLHMAAKDLLLIVVLILCVGGFYALYEFSSRLISLTGILNKEKTSKAQRVERRANLKRNWYLPLLAMSFFFLASYNSLAYYLGMPIAFSVMLAVASRLPSLWDYVKKQNLVMRLFCALSAVGICLGNSAGLSIPENANIVVLAFAWFIFITASIFVYVCLAFFWNEMQELIKKSAVFQGITKTESIIYAILFFVSIAFMVFVFAQSQAFYGTDLLFDVIYTSDSPYLVKGNVYLALTHQENDLRQPLFAVFAAPFIGLPYLIGNLLGASAAVQAMLINTVQIAMLFTANFILSKVMRLSSMKRICFMLLSSCTYSHLLFTLMMEQYIIAYFWLIFCIYQITEKQQISPIALCGAGGTMLTSMILLPFTSEKSPMKQLKEWLKDVINNGLSFILMLLGFCRFDVIFFLAAKIAYLGEFTGRELTMMDKVNQYTAFIKNCFVAPAAGLNTTAFNHISWQLNAVNSINLVGVVILLFAIISLILNRNKNSSIISAVKVGFSMVMLVGLGWGTNENGLILYALYFGWAFLVLLFQLVEKIEAKLKVRFLLPAVCIGTATGLTIMNIPAIMEMVNFAITHYPA